MKKKIPWMALVLVGTLLRGGLSADRWRVIWHGTGGWGDKNAYCALFNPNTITTMSGTVASIDQITPMPGMRPGVQLQLRTEKGTIPVHLGPLWYLENQDITLAPNDKVDVTGSKVFCVNQDILMATEVRRGDKTLKLRDLKGHSLWVVTNP